MSPRVNNFLGIGRSLVLAVLGASVPATASAANFGLMHEVSVYADAAAKALRAPDGIACYEDGRFIVADTGNGRMLKYGPASRKVSGGEELKFPAITAPSRLRLTKSGDLFVLDAKVHRIFHLNATGSLVGPVVISGAPIPKEGGKEVEVGAFALDAAGGLYVYDQAADRVLVLSDAGVFVREIMIPSATGRRAITDIYVDSQGTIYLLEVMSSTVFAAGKNDGVFVARTKSLKKDVEFPVYLMTMEPDRTLVVVDSNGGRLALIGTDGTLMSRQLSLGQGDGFLYYPTQICTNGLGQLLVADRGNHRIQVFKTTR